MNQFERSFPLIAFLDSFAEHHSEIVQCEIRDQKLTVKSLLYLTLISQDQSQRGHQSTNLNGYSLQRARSMLPTPHVKIRWMRPMCMGIDVNGLFLLLGRAFASPFGIGFWIHVLAHIRGINQEFYDPHPVHEEQSRRSYSLTCGLLGAHNGSLVFLGPCELSAGLLLRAVLELIWK